MTDGARREGPVTSDLVLGRYRLEERLGLGGSAEVWRGVDERLGRPVAVKLLHPHLLPDEAARARFEREARAAAALAHPGIVAVFDVEASPSRAAIIFELVDGETLADRLARDGALPPSEAARVGAELAEALQHAHERGIVHRDVKPGNVLLERDGRARLVDFGIARLLERESAHLTTAGTVTGTLRYLAPEQLAGDGVGASADIYALGVVLFEMLTGRPPFEVSTPVALAEAQLDPPERIAGVPRGLASIALEAMRPDPAQRPADAGAMAARLRLWEGRGAAAVPHGNEDPTVVVPVPRAVAPDSGTTPPEARWPLTPPRERRTRQAPTGWWRAALSIGLLALVFLVVAALVGSGLFSGGGTSTRGLPSTTPTASPTGSSTASPTASSTGTPTAAPALSLSEAAAAFERLVSESRDDGTIESRPADDLLKLAQNVLDARGIGKVRQAIDELRSAVDKDEREGAITSATVAAQLRSLVDQMGAAARGG